MSRPFPRLPHVNVQLVGADGRCTPEWYGVLLELVQRTEPSETAVNVLALGADSTGVADSSTAIQAALDTGKEIYLPDGDFLVDTGINILTNGQMLRGAGNYRTRIIPSFSSGNVVSIGDGSTGIIGARVSNLSVAKQGSAMSSGSLIRVGKNCGNTTLDHIQLSKGFNGIYVEGGGTSTTVHVDNFYIEECGQAGITLGDTVGVATDTFVSNGTIAICGIGLNIIAASGGFFSQIDILVCTNNGVYLNGGATNPIAFLFFDQVLADTNTNYGWLVDSTGAKIGGVTLNNCWSAGNGLDGFLFNTANLNGFTIQNTQIRNNQHNGILVSAGSNVLIKDNQIFHNSLAGAGTYHGINVAANVNDFVIEGNISGKGGYDAAVGSSNLQGYGILVNAGTSDRYLINYNRMPINVTGGLNDGGTGVNKIVGNNAAY